MATKLKHERYECTVKNCGWKSDAGRFHPSLTGRQQWEQHYILVHAAKPRIVKFATRRD